MHYPSMACTNMYNKDEQKNGLYTSIGPRISFSNDFTDTQMAIKKDINKYREAPVSSEFEFSVTRCPNVDVRHADEIFSKGTLWPSQDNNYTNQFQKMTLRDTLTVYDDEDDTGRIFPKPPKYSGKWKERFGLKMPNLSKTFGKNGGELETVYAKNYGYVYRGSF